MRTFVFLVLSLLWLFFGGVGGVSLLTAKSDNKKRENVEEEDEDYEENTASTVSKWFYLAAAVGATIYLGLFFFLLFMSSSSVRTLEFLEKAFRFSFLLIGAPFIVTFLVSILGMFPKDGDKYKYGMLIYYAGAIGGFLMSALVIHSDFAYILSFCIAMLVAYIVYLKGVNGR